MRNLVLSLATACAVIVPAAAAAETRLVTGPQVHRGHHDGDRFGDRRDARRSRGGDALFVTEVNGGEWARYNNRGWEPDSYNDWWHDRPDRAFPRWVQQAQHGGICDEDRMWWSGAGWRC